MTNNVINRKMFLFLIYSYLLLSFLNELKFISPIIKMIPLLKYVTLALLTINVCVYLLTNMKVSKVYVYSLVTFVYIQILNIIFDLISFNILSGVSVSMSYILLIWIFFLHTREIKIEEKNGYIKIIYYTLLLLLLLTISYTIITGNWLTSAIAGRVRYLFGFSNVNRLGSLIFLLFNMGLFLLKNAIKKREKVIIIMGLIFLTIILLLTDSRTPLFIIFIQLATIIIMKVKLFKRINYYYVVVISIGVLFYIIRSNILSSTYYYVIDMALSGRLSNWANIIVNMKGYEFAFGITNESTYNIISDFYPEYKSGLYIDNFYIYYFFNNGLFGLTLLLAYFGHVFKLIRKHTNNTNKKILISLFWSTLIYGFFEGWLLSVNNITSILFWVFLSIVISLNPKQS